MEEAMERITRVETPVGRAPLPGTMVRQIQLTIGGWLLFFLSLAAGVYVTNFMDGVAEKAAVAREETRRKDEARKQAEREYENLKQSIPPAQLEALLKAAGGKEALMRRLRRSWNGQFYLEREQ